MTSDEMERLWDAFEELDAAAAAIAYGRTSYVKVPSLNRLRAAIYKYRSVRDEISLRREMDPTP